MPIRSLLTEPNPSRHASAYRGIPGDPIIVVAGDDFHTKGGRKRSPFFGWRRLMTVACRPSSVVGRPSSVSFRFQIYIFSGLEIRDAGHGTRDVKKSYLKLLFVLLSQRRQRDYIYPIGPAITHSCSCNNIQ